MKFWGNSFRLFDTFEPQAPLTPSLNTFLTHVLKCIQLRWYIEKLLNARNFRVQINDVT